MRPKRYRAQYIEPGIISYEDVGDGKVFVGKPALDQMQGSFVGAPVVNRVHKDLSAEEAFDRRNEDPESWADGIITATGYDDGTGWYWADMLVWDEETQRNIDQNGYSVSCSYIPTTTAGPGSYHGIDYDEEVLTGQYTHMAIVDNPRYEDSVIYANSKKGKKHMKFKLFSNEEKKTAAQEKKNSEPSEEVQVDLNNAIIENEDGTQVPMEELVTAYRNSKEEEKKETAQKMNMDDEVDVDGEMVPVRNLLEAYKANKAKKNEEEDEDKENAEAPQDEPMEEPVDEAKQKQNMRKVRSASEKGGEVDRSDIETRSDRIERGKSRYTRKVAQGGK